MIMIKIILQKETLKIDKVINEIGEDTDGAVVIFIGRVRNNSNKRVVEFIYYEINENMAHKELELIVDDAIAKWHINSCMIIHRYGRVEIGEASIIIAVSCPHREEAFQSARYIIDTVKKKVPIWKKEYYTNGSNWIIE